MNICLSLANFLPRYYGGLQKFIYELGKGLQERGHRVYVLCTEGEASPDGELLTEEDYRGLSVARVWLGLNKPSFDERLVNYNDSIGNVCERFFREKNIDVLHVSSFVGLSTALVRAAHSMDIPVLYRASDFGNTCWRYLLVRWDGTLCSGNEEFLHCLDCFRPFSTTSKSMFSFLSRLPETTRSKLLDLVSTLPGRKPWLLERALLLRKRFKLHRPAFLDIDLVIAPSEWMREVLLLNGFHEEKVIVSTTGVHFAPPGWKKTSSHVFRFGYIGRIVPAKGVDLVVDAFNQLPAPDGATLTVFGVPTSQAEFAYAGRVWALARGNPNVRLGASFESDGVSKAFREIDILVVPSTWHENSSRVILEAFAHRTPVIISDVKGNLDHVVDEQNGLLFTNGDVASLTSQMQRCISDPDLHALLVKNVQPIRSVAEQTEELLQHYLRLVNGRPRPKMDKFAFHSRNP